MINEFVGQGRKRKLLVKGVVTLSLILGLVGIEYQRYAYAVVWHWGHGSYAQVAGHKVRLPLFWWKEDVEDYDTTVLKRASPLITYLQPTIVVSPAIRGEVRETDEEELKSTQTVISMKGHASPAGPSSSLVTITARPFTLYCVRVAAIQYGYMSLTCHAAHVQYSFTYNGHPMHEKDAEAILSSLE